MVGVTRLIVVPQALRFGVPKYRTTSIVDDTHQISLTPAYTMTSSSGMLQFARGGKQKINMVVRACVFAKEEPKGSLRRSFQRATKYHERPSQQGTEIWHGYQGEHLC
jgi:hypothetical protein